jgi:hypothetical protein
MDGKRRKEFPLKDVRRIVLKESLKFSFLRLNPIVPARLFGRKYFTLPFPQREKGAGWST